jgi:hypothetical protein
MLCAVHLQCRNQTNLKGPKQDKKGKVSFSERRSDAVYHSVRVMEPHEGASSPLPPEEASRPGHLLALPLPALALIYQHSDSASHTAILRASREGRDAVLREARSIKLQVRDGTPAARKPLVRLLSRACEAASEGRLSLVLNAFGFALEGEQSSELLADLLLPAHQAHGWKSVSKLELRVRTWLRQDADMAQLSGNFP